MLTTGNTLDFGNVIYIFGSLESSTQHSKLETLGDMKKDIFV